MSDVHLIVSRHEKYVDTGDGGELLAMDAVLEASVAYWHCRQPQLDRDS
jgi:hypothetical protein